MGGGYQGPSASSVFAAGAISGIAGGILGGIQVGAQNTLNQEILGSMG